MRPRPAADLRPNGFDAGVVLKVGIVDVAVAELVVVLVVVVVDLLGSSSTGAQRMAVLGTRPSSDMRGWTWNGRLVDDHNGEGARVLSKYPPAGAFVACVLVPVAAEGAALDVAAVIFGGAAAAAAVVASCSFLVAAHAQAAASVVVVVAAENGDAANGGVRDDPAAAPWNV